MPFSLSKDTTTEQGNIIIIKKISNSYDNSGTQSPPATLPRSLHPAARQTPPPRYEKEERKEEKKKWNTSFVYFVCFEVLRPS